MGMVSRRLKRTTKQYITVCVLAMLVTGGSAAGVTLKFINGIRLECNNRLKECYKEMNDNKRMVYRVTRDVMKGEVLTEDCVGIDNVYAAQPPATFIDENDIGKVAIIDIMTGTQVLKSMVSEDTVNDGVREAEFSTILISSNLLENDVVDIRISYPNGEDYTVLSKKVLKGYKGDKTVCFLWLTEEEIIRMHNAIVDAYLYTGSYLYTTKYIEPNLQEATVVNYTPTLEAISLIQKNPNILETAMNELSTSVRKALENRLAQSLNKDVRDEKWNLDSDDIYQESNKQIKTDTQTDTGKNITKNKTGAVTDTDKNFSKSEQDTVTDTGKTISKSEQDTVTDTGKNITKSETNVTINPAIIPKADDQGVTAAPLHQEELPKTGELDSKSGSSNSSESELGSNTEIPGEKADKQKLQTSYFAVTEG